MAEKRTVEVVLSDALSLMRQALEILDRDEQFDLVGARLQEAIDAAEFHQSQAPPDDRAHSAEP